MAAISPPSRTTGTTEGSVGGSGWLAAFVGEWRSLTRLGAFILITLATAVRRYRDNSRVIRPQVLGEIHRCGVRLLPIVGFLGVVLGIVFVGQTVSLMEQVGASNFMGTLMVTVFLREMAPMIAGLLVLARVGTASVVELGTARALGEVEALEVLGIDPIHYLVVPRVVGFAAAVVSLTAYLILISLGSGYVFAYARGLKASPMEFFTAIAGAMTAMDFPLLVLKTLLFGALTGWVICYQGLARPMTLEEVGPATTRTVAVCVVGCLMLDALFITVFLLL
jgi:phospholipid/cholesterol/gamma-HCH transport system permease protein